MTKIYRNLARNAMGKNKIIYVPYIISGMMMILITYIITAIAKDSYLRRVEGGATLQQIMIIGVPIMYVISFFFLFGVSRFVIKQRKKELGVYCVLGMQKKHIIHVQFLETLYTFLISVAAGTVIGVMLEKVFQLLFLRIYHQQADFSFDLPLNIILTNAMIFGFFFLCFFVFNSVGILRSNILEYMKDEAKGEKQPKSKWILAIAGVLLLGGGYALSLTTKEGLQAIQLFGLAVLLVILGTFALFTAGSITLLNALKRNKKFYYKTGHFISVSGMLYRMKRNAANLATISIFATMVLVTMSSVMTLYSTVHDMAESWYVVDFDVLYSVPEDGKVRDERIAKIREAAEKTGVSIDELYVYQYINSFALVKDDEITVTPTYISLDVSEVFVFTEDIYDYVNGTDLGLEKDEVAVFSRSGNAIKDQIRFRKMDDQYRKTDDASETFRVRHIEDAPKISSGSSIAISDGIYYIVVKDGSVMDSLRPYIHESGIDDYDATERLLVNSSSGRSEQLKMYEELEKNTKYYDYITVHSKIDSVEEVTGLYAGLFFLGVFLSISFLTITILNMYFSQLQQGHEDAKRFAIMRKVGLTKKEIRKSVNSQIVIVFLLPLMVAVMHTAASYPMVNKILQIMGGCEPRAFIIIVGICVALFATVYTIAYLFTRRTYLKMVSGAYDGK